MSNGAKNLIILGLTATVIAIISTSISLLIYHHSGDIYLDRSRPGFLPDASELNENEQAKTGEDYSFSESGALSPTDLDEYLKNFTTEIDDINKVEKPFDASALSNDILGIPTSE